MKEDGTPGHPTARKLAAYQDGQLTSEEEEEIQEHLAECRECTRALLDLADFQDLMESEDLETVTQPEELPGPGQTQASWQALSARLGASRPEAVAVPSPVSRFRRRIYTPKVVLLMAASLLGCLIGFPLWIATHGGPGTAQPVAAYPPGNGEITRGTSDSSLVARLSDGPAVVALALPPRASFLAYRVEIWAPGELRLSAEAVPVPVAMASNVAPEAHTPAKDGPPPRLVALALGRGQLAAGDYSLRLIGVRGQAGSPGEVIAVHKLRVPPS